MPSVKENDPQQKPPTVEQQWRADVLAVWREIAAQLRRIADAAHGPYGGSGQ